MSLALLVPDIVVSQHGTATFRTITEAINAVPDHSSMRTVIYIKAGRYEEENLQMGSQKTNIVMIGDGIGKTVITGRKNVKDDHVHTYHTTSFAATDAGFMATNITFENRTGPYKGQAVALRVSSERAVFYRCSFLGYQDTLYVHSNFVQSKKIFQTYLGRLWANYSRIVYMSCWMDDHITPQGWIPVSTIKNDTVPDTLFYGEFNNSGPSASVFPRANWTSYHRLLLQKKFRGLLSLNSFLDQHGCLRMEYLLLQDYQIERL
ncbi:hypothetical protein C5167_007845 [Papaver somniferum]|nr:hypothetical protein C5167_007845 [Papaver somniferum]